MARPVIGICTALERARWSVWDQEAFLLSRSYVGAVQRAAGETLHATKSHHHQGVDRLGDGLEITGWAVMDHLPEAIEDPERRFALGVQWHPEADDTSRLIAALVEEAAAARDERALEDGARRDGVKVARR